MSQRGVADAGGVRAVMSPTWHHCSHKGWGNAPCRVLMSRPHWMTSPTFCDILTSPPPFLPHSCYANDPGTLRPFGIWGSGATGINKMCTDLPGPAVLFEWQSEGGPWIRGGGCAVRPPPLNHLQIATFPPQAPQTSRVPHRRLNMAPFPPSNPLQTPQTFRLWNL